MIESDSQNSVILNAKTVLRTQIHQCRADSQPGKEGRLSDKGFCLILRCQVSGKRIIRIGDPGQIQPTRRTDRAALGPVARIQRLGHSLDAPGSGAHSFQRAHETADLIVKKRTRAHVEVDFGAMGALDRMNVKPVECFQRTLRLTDAGPERREIMLADEGIGCILHLCDVERMFDLPDKPGLMGCRGAAGEYPEQIPPFDG